MVRRNFKFFDFNEIPPYNQYVTGDFTPIENNGGYIRNRTWHWTNTSRILREEPDGYLRAFYTSNFPRYTFNEFLRRFDHYEIYIYSIHRNTEGQILTLYAPNINNQQHLSELIDMDDDLLIINAILI